MTRNFGITAAGILVGFVSGIFSHMLYLRWNPPLVETSATMSALQLGPWTDSEAAKQHSVSYIPLSHPAAAEEKPLDLPVVVARDVEKIRSLTGRQARVRGRVFRVGYSARSKTYFLNFGPSREALTAVIFKDSVELFDKNKQPPKMFEHKEVEVTGQIKDHPQFGLEVVLESPKQISIVQ